MTSPSPTPERPFRDRALGGGANPLEHVDHLFRHTSRRIWLGVLGLALLLGAGVLWTAVADESITADASALIVPRQGIYTVGDLNVGVVTAVLVREGQVVHRGQPLARIQAADSGRVVGVPSSVARRILSVQVRAGDPSGAGSPMFLIAPLKARSMAIALVPASAVSQFRVGQKATVAVNGVAPDLYGRAIGRVASIGNIPDTDQRLRQLTGDSSLLGLVSQLGSVREVRIALTGAPTPSGVAWTGGAGPPAPIPVGSHAVVTITVARRRLIDKVFR
jgi:multidrug efflux pump subunit AcrA (membrane-fusion protein)